MNLQLSINKQQDLTIIVKIYAWKQYLWTQKTAMFFLIGVHSMQGWTATMRHGVTRKRRTEKKLKHTGNFFRKNLQLKDVC